jgi:hypothetical protein
MFPFDIDLISAPVKGDHQEEGTRRAGSIDRFGKIESFRRSGNGGA